MALLYTSLYLIPSQLRNRIPINKIMPVEKREEADKRLFEISAKIIIDIVDTKTLFG